MKRLPSLAAAAALALPMCLASPAAKAGRPLMPEDWYRFQDVSDVVMSPDGSAVAYLVTSYDRDSDESRGAVWIADWAGKGSVQLTREESASEPRFSPDGRYVSFLSARPAGSATRLWRVDRRGGEPRQLSHCNGEITGYDWSPDGKRIALVMHPVEDAKSPKPVVIDAYQFKDKYTYLSAQTRSHLYLLDLGSGACQALTTDRQRADSAPAFSPDGRQIAYLSNSTQTPGEAAVDAIYLVAAAAGSSPRRLLSTWPPSHQHLEWSPDGRLIAFLHGDDPKYNIYMFHLAVAEVPSGRVRELSASLDRTVYSPKFASAGRSILLAVEDDGTQYPARVMLESGAIERLADGIVADEIATAAGHVAVLASDDRSPFEVFALEEGRLRALSHHNRALFTELALGSVEDIVFRSRDGTEIHGQIVKPADYVRGRRYPAILWIQGGPDGQNDHSLLLESYGPQLERQLFATHGYVVLGINHRGGTGRGTEFARAITADWGHKEIEDLLAGVDYVIEQGVADPARLGVGGWSYGGVLTDYLIASDTRFRCAISGAGVGNQLSLYGSDAWVVGYDAELGPPWRNTALWLRLSYPFFHGERIRTPTLFMGGDKDFNVPIGGSEQMYQALRTLGVPAQLIVYPGENHLLARPSFLVDRYRRYLDWMQKYLEAKR